VVTNRSIRIAVQLQPQHADYRALREAVTAAEQIGVDVIFNWDHFYPLSGDRDGKHFECWTMLAAWAEQTTRVEFGALVSCNSYRNPELLADMARTVDHISDGRLILGIGSGWFEHDYVEYGYEFGTAGGRLDDLGRALPRIVERWGKLNPPPTRKIPVLIETLKRKSLILDDWCARVGRDPSEIERSVGVPKGEPAEVGPALLDAGGTLLTIGVGGPDYDLTQVARWLAWRDSVK
jgi:Luciferase-like monooxygenase